MKSRFYRPEQTNLQEFGRIIRNLEEDLLEMEKCEVSENELMQYFSELLPQAGFLDYRPEMCFFGLDDPNHMPGDARVDFFYWPTYLVTAMVMHAMIRFPEISSKMEAEGKLPSGDWKKITTACMKASTGREFYGDGYDAYRGMLEVMELFLKAGVLGFLEKYPEWCPDFTETVKLRIDDLKNDYAEGEIIRGFCENFTQRVRLIVEKFGLLEESEEEGCRWYIAYGSNLNKEVMKQRCPGAELAGTAVLKGWRLMFKKSQSGFYLTIEEKEGHNVPVAVWKVKSDDETRLDRYEGCPRHYYKRDVIVKVNQTDGTSLTGKAFAYVLPANRAFGWPTQRYMATCQKGYKDFGFDEEVLWDALKYSDSQSKCSDDGDQR